MFKPKKSLLIYFQIISGLSIISLILFIFLILIYKKNQIAYQYLMEPSVSSKPDTINTIPTPYKVGIFYFGIYSPMADSLIKKTYESTGRVNDWWGGVRDFHGDPDYSPPVTVNTQGWEGDFSHLKPAIGYYNLAEKETVERHIRQAVSHGISFFNFYWYWNNDTHNEKFNDGLDSFIAAKNSTDINFTLFIVSPNSPGFKIPYSDMNIATETIVNKYLTKTNYLRTLDGRPIINIGDPNGIDGVEQGYTQAIIDFANLLRNKTMEKLGIYPFITINSELLKDLRDTVNTESIDGYNCLTAHLFAGIDPNHGDYIGSYEYYALNFASNYLTQFNNAPFLPCYMSDFSEKQRTAIFKPKDQIQYVPDWSLDLFENGLKNVKNYIDTHDNNPVNNYVSIYAWNEWQEENNNLEPSEKYGDRMLDKVARIFNLPTFGDDYCQIYGYCQGKPTGNLDKADCDKISGWARNPNFEEPIMIHIYKDNSFFNGGTYITSVPAKNFRSNLPFPDKYHGFSISTPQEFKTGKDELIYIHAVSDGSTNPLISGVPKTINCLP